jgi:hypothetical protein
MPTGFLGLDFTPLELGHAALLRKILETYPQPLCDYTFASLLAWGKVCVYRVAKVGETILVSGHFEEDAVPHLLQPLGPFPCFLQEHLLTQARVLPHALRIASVSETFLSEHADFAKHFHITPLRDAANYVYETRDLARLPGRRYSAKRNLIAQAASLYHWQVSALTPQHASDCLAVADDIASKRSAETGITLVRETQALREILMNLNALGLRGLTLYVDGKLAAFSVFDRLGPNTAVILFERALRNHKGLSQVINHETARLLETEGYEFINREEDLGDPGLRKAKLSYHPARLEASCTLTFIPA